MTTAHAFGSKQERFASVRENVARDGFAIIENVLPGHLAEKVVNGILAANGAGIREPHRTVAAIGELVRTDEIRELVAAVIGTRARVVRSIFFDKTAEANWAVPWHQDLTIAVKEHREVAGFVGWSVKDSVDHVQAPREVLEQMLTVRLHLDDCGIENGPLPALPGTHRHGWLDSDAINHAKREIPEHVCTVRRGGAVVMRPLLLHASSRATEPRHRRVLHLEFAADDLPGGLEFHR